ncbi:hypothetical protein EJB05_36982, partial [Eragrostis curvula]
IDGCYLASVDGISSESLKCLSIGGSCSLGQSFRNLIYVPNLISLHLDLDFDRAPVLEKMPSLVAATVNINYSEIDSCLLSDSGNCDYEHCESCYEIEGDNESCVLLQGLSKAKNLALKSNKETGTKSRIEMKGRPDPKKQSLTISKRLKLVEVKCDLVDEKVMNVLQFMIKFNIIPSLQI